MRLYTQSLGARGTNQNLKDDKDKFIYMTLACYFASDRAWKIDLNLYRKHLFDHKLIYYCFVLGVYIERCIKFSGDESSAMSNDIAGKCCTNIEKNKVLLLLHAIFLSRCVTFPFILDTICRNKEPTIPHCKVRRRWPKIFIVQFGLWKSKNQLERMTHTIK